MKQLKMILIIGLLFLGFPQLGNSQCDIRASVYPTRVCAGDAIFLTSRGACGYLMNNNFNNNTIGAGWNSTAANPVFNNPCGPGPNGSHLWVGTTASSSRTLITIPYDVSIGGCKIRWYMRYGLVPGSGPCEDPDASNEGVHMQYSTNGTTWTDFPGQVINPQGPNSVAGPYVTNTHGSGGYWTPESSTATQTNSTLYYWHSYENVIPPVATTTNTSFRWAQTANSSAGFDAWGIDEVEILCPNSDTKIMWSTGDSVFNPGQVIMPPHPQNLAYDTCFIVHIWDSLNPIGAYDTVCVRVLPIPTAEFSVIDSNTCEYDSVHITYAGSAPNNSIFSWMINNQSFSGPGPHSFLFPAGTYTADLTVNQEGCESSVKTHTINVNPKPLLSFSPNKYTGCVPLEVDFLNYSSPAGSSYLWNFGDGGSSALENPNHVFTQGGTYTVSLSATSVDGCYDTTSFTNLIQAYPSPTANFYATPTVTNIDNPIIQFTDISTGAASWLWEFGDGNNSTVQSPSHTYNSDGEFTTWLFITSDKGCMDSVSYLMRVIVDEIEVPNVITPNGDGFNDVFYVKNIDKLESSTVIIYNRWGAKIYESDNYKNNWDGDGAPDGVYFYVIKYTTFFDEFETTGTLTILNN